MLKNKNHYANDSITVTELNKCVRQIIENNIEIYGFMVKFQSSHFIQAVIGIFL